MINLQFLPGPERNGHFVSVNVRLKVKNARLYGQNLGSPRVETPCMAWSRDIFIAIPAFLFSILTALITL